MDSRSWPGLLRVAARPFQSFGALEKGRSPEVAHSDKHSAVLEDGADEIISGKLLLAERQAGIHFWRENGHCRGECLGWEDVEGLRLALPCGPFADAEALVAVIAFASQLSCMVLSM